MSSRQTRKIDWAAARERVRSSERALDEAATPSDERVAEVLRNRAERLAGRSLNDSGREELVQALVFRLGEERYAVELEAIAEVLSLPRWTPVPGARPEILGIVNLHGEMCPLVDLARLVGLAPLDADGELDGYALVARFRGSFVLFRVEAVERVRAIETLSKRKDREEPERFPARYLKGFTKDILPVVDVPALFSHSVFKEGTGP